MALRFSTISFLSDYGLEDEFVGVVRSVVRSIAPDVALIDVGLPDLDGHELVRRARAEGGGPPPYLVAVTGYGQPEDERRAREVGFDAHLPKPLDWDRLDRLLATLPPPPKQD